MSLFLGIARMARQTNILSVNNTNTGVTLQNTDLTLPIAANQRLMGWCRVPITLAGAASGAKFNIAVPAGGTLYQVEFEIYNGSTNALATAGVLLAAANFSNALANAANHYMKCTFDITNGVTAGNVTLQFAQLVADAANASLLAGATMWGLAY